MTEEKKEAKPTKGVSRREFIAGTVGGLAVGAVVGAATGSLAFPTIPASVSEPWLPAKWDYTADVVVVGFGGAGAAAAIAAANAGASVILLEKMPEGLEGGNTGTSGGEFNCTSSATDFVTYFNALADGYPIPQDLLQAWAQDMSQNADWIKSIGGNPIVTMPLSSANANYQPYPSTYHTFPEFPGVQSSYTWRAGAPPGLGYDFFAFLKSVVQQKSNITVMYSTRATSLIQNGVTKEILGVKAIANYSNPITSDPTNTGSGTINIKANKAVILALGGYENNPQMLRDFAQISNGGQWGTPGNTGDGIPMVKSVGAALWHLDNFINSGFGFTIPALPNGPALILSMPAAGYIYVGKDGMRFMNETYSFIREGKIPINYVASPTPGANTQWVQLSASFPMHVIFDETTRKAGPITMPSGTNAMFGYAEIHSLYSWSSDNSVEISKGWISSANTLQDLATSIGRDPTTMASVIAQYNGYCQTGIDVQFGRSKSTLAAIQTPPYYAVPLLYLLVNTMGGAKRNAKSQVVDDNDNPIPRLYSAGEFGSIISWCYQGGSAVGDTQATGRTAGQNAAAETPWS